MSNKLFKLGGGAGVGSFIIALDHGTIKNPKVLRIRESYDCGESLYLSIIDDVTEEALLPLSGYVDENDILHLSGRDFDDNVTYEFSIDVNNDEVTLNTVDGITMGDGVIPTEGGGGGGDAVIILDDEHPDPEDITDLKKLYRRDGDIPSNLQQPAVIHTEGVDTITNAQVATNNVQVNSGNISTFFDSEFNNVVKVTGTTMNLFSFRVVENDTPISAIRVGPRTEDAGVLEIQPAGTTTTLRIGKYFYVDYETGDRVYDTAATVMVDGITYTFDSDDEILEIETDSEDILIRNGAAEYSRIIVYSIETQGDPVDEWALDPLDSIREREQSVSELRKTLMENHITPTEATVASHTTDIQNLKTGVRDLGNALATTNSHIGNIKIDSINRLPQPAYEYLNQIYRVGDKYYECYVSVPGDAQYFEWMFNVNGTSEITESNWDAFAGDVGHGFADNTEFNNCSKLYRNAGSIKLGSSSATGAIGFRINLEHITQIEIDYAGYSATKPSNLYVIAEDDNDSWDTTINATDNTRKTLTIENIDMSNALLDLESDTVETTDDKRFIIYGIRVHAGTPATYAWREIGVNVTDILSRITYIDFQDNPGEYETWVFPVGILPVSYYKASHDSTWYFDYEHMEVNAYDDDQTTLSGKVADITIVNNQVRITDPGRYFDMLISGVSESDHIESMIMDNPDGTYHPRFNTHDMCHSSGGGGGSTYYKHDIRWDVQGDPDKRICFSFISTSSESINTNVKMRTLLSNKPHILDNMACYYEDDVSENYLAGPITWASASSSSVTVQMFSPNSSYHTEEWTFTNAPSDTVTEL